MKRFLLMLVILAAFAISFEGCARSCESLDRQFEVGERNYIVEVYSGGQLIREYRFRGILNNQDNSDGYYFTMNGKLIEVGGDILVQSWE